MAKRKGRTGIRQKAFKNRIRTIKDKRVNVRLVR